MSIIIATTAAEAAAVVRELDGKSTTITTDSAEEAAAVLPEYRNKEFAQNLAVCREMSANLPPWDGFARESAAETAAGVPEEADIDLTDTAATLAEKDGETLPRNRTWMPTEESVLKRWIRDGLTVKQVGERLGRSSSSVRNKLAALEKERAALGLDPIKPKKVTA